MHTILMLMALAAAPFWESKPPAEWSEVELSWMLHASPWVQAATCENKIGGIAPVEVYLASAQPMREAEEQLRLRHRKKGASTTAQEELDQEYLGFMADNPGKYMVLAVRFPNRNALADAVEAKRMEEESLLKVRRKKYKIVGHFPPTSSDPYLRLIYPRVVETTDKEFTFELYLPAAAAPYREALFKVKDLVYKGAPEM